MICKLPRLSGWRSLVQSFTDMDDYNTNTSDYDTPTQEDSEPQSASGKAQELIAH